MGGPLVQTALTDRDRRPEALRKLAELVVDIRRHYTNENGDIDWKGRTWEYRERMRDFFEKWGVPADSEDNIQASLRYHVGNYLREALTPEELVRAGLQPTGPRQRLQNTRDELRAIVRAITRSEELAEGDLPTAVALDAARRLLAIVDARQDESVVEKKNQDLLRQVSRHVESLKKRSA